MACFPRHNPFSGFPPHLVFKNKLHYLAWERSAARYDIMLRCPARSGVPYFVLNDIMFAAPIDRMTAICFPGFGQLADDCVQLLALISDSRVISQFRFGARHPDPRFLANDLQRLGVEVSGWSLTAPDQVFLDHELEEIRPPHAGHRADLALDIFKFQCGVRQIQDLG